MYLMLRTAFDGVLVSSGDLCRKAEAPTEPTGENSCGQPRYPLLLIAYSLKRH